MSICLDIILVVLSLFYEVYEEKKYFEIITETLSLNI